MCRQAAAVLTSARRTLWWQLSTWCVAVDWLSSQRQTPPEPRTERVVWCWTRRKSQFLIYYGWGGVCSRMSHESSQANSSAPVVSVIAAHSGLFFTAQPWIKCVNFGQCNFLNNIFIHYLQISHHEHPAHSLPSPLGSTQPHLCDLPPQKRRKSKQTNKSNLCCPYTHWSMVKLPVFSP